VGPGPRDHRLRRRLFQVLVTAGAVSAAIGLAACGSEQPSDGQGLQVVGSGAAPSAAPEGTSTEIRDSMDVIDARIPAAPEGSATAQVEVTLADISAAGPDVLRAASSTAAQAVEFTSNGHAVPRITIPAAAGSSLSTGPPNPDRILLTGLRRQLRAGQTVTISLVFARAGQVTLHVPVIPATP
jgi:copper(I)-binding protein